MVFKAVLSCQYCGHYHSCGHMRHASAIFMSAEYGKNNWIWEIMDKTGMNTDTSLKGTNIQGFDQAGLRQQADLMDFANLVVLKVVRGVGEPENFENVFRDFHAWRMTPIFQHLSFCLLVDLNGTICSQLK